MLTINDVKQKCFMKEEFDIIILGLFRWNGPYSSISIAMAKEFAKHNRVFYINHPYSYKDYYVELKGEENRSIRKNLSTAKNNYKPEGGFPKDLIQVTPPLTYPINSLSKGMIYDFFARKNQALVQNSIQQIVDDYNLDKYIFINCYDPFFGELLPEHKPPFLKIYQSVDDISQDEYTSKHGVYLEEKAIKNADLTLVTSTELYRLKSQFTSNIHVLHNAADIEVFEQALFNEFEVPVELRNIKGPIIGYIGNLDELRVDYDLIKKIALKHQNKNLVFIGPINNTKYKEIGLDKLSNVHFLGKRPITQLAPYLQNFDCAIIPFQLNTLTKSIYPLKINEYLAAGKPVIATNFSKDISSFKEHIYLSQTDEDFVSLINKSLAEDNPALARKRHVLAQSNTWEARIAQFWQIVNEYIPQKVMS